MATQITAYCWRSGLIQFGEAVPDGAMPIAAGPEKELREVVDIHATHGWDKALRVGGVPTAMNENEALIVLEDFQNRVMSDLAMRMQGASHA